MKKLMALSLLCSTLAMAEASFDTCTSCTVVCTETSVTTQEVTPVVAVLEENVVAVPEAIKENDLVVAKKAKKEKAAVVEEAVTSKE
jgi:hypothetical protein